VHDQLDLGAASRRNPAHGDVGNAIAVQIAPRRIGSELRSLLAAPAIELQSLRGQIPGS
jgi:hypothetical protein